MIELPIYVYTVPKAGTYFLGALLQELGYIDTGWHISTDSYLDTKKFDETTNTEYPSKTQVKQFYLQTFNQIPPAHFAFGHFCPGQLLNRKAKQFFFISSYRHPKEVLESEFIDFRYRRKDVAFVAESEVGDPFAAFELYMEKHAFIIKNIFVNFLFFQERYLEPLYQEVFGKNNLCVDFKSLLETPISDRLLTQLSTAFDRSSDEIVASVEKAKLRDNKTKSIGLKLPFHRSELWTPNAQHFYSSLKFHEVENYLKKLYVS